MVLWIYVLLYHVCEHSINYAWFEVVNCFLFTVQYLFARVNGTWRRAEIKKVMDRSVIIFCVDYGHTTTVKCHDLRPAIGKVLSPLGGLKLLFRMDSLLTDQIMLS